MPWIFLFLLGCLAAMALVMLAAIWGMNRATQLMVGTKHHLLEGIFDTGDVPQEWSRRAAARLAKASRAAGDPGSAAGMTRLQEQAKASYLHRLDALIRYARDTRIVRDEETRRVLLDRLSAVRREWSERKAEELR